MLGVLFTLAAIIAFCLAAAGVTDDQVVLVPLGLALWAFATIVDGVAIGTRLWRPPG